MPTTGSDLHITFSLVLETDKRFAPSLNTESQTLWKQFRESEVRIRWKVSGITSARGESPLTLKTHSATGLPLPAVALTGLHQASTFDRLEAPVRSAHENMPAKAAAGQTV